MLALLVVGGVFVGKDFFAGVVTPAYNPYASLLDIAVTPKPTPAPPSDIKTHRDMRAGFEFQYSSLRFAAFDVRGGVRLISAPRASQMGKKQCIYDTPGILELCDPEREGGISFIFVPKSIENAKKSFSLRVTGDSYDFVSLSPGATLLVVRNMQTTFAPDKQMVADILATLKHTQ